LGLTDEQMRDVLERAEEIQQESLERDELSADARSSRPCPSGCS
jgi:hypothetical protein